MIPARRRSRLSAPGQLGCGPAPCFFLFDQFYFPFCSSSPISTSIARDLFGCFTLCSSFPFLFFTLLTFLSLALMGAGLATAGFRQLPNKYNNITTLLRLRIMFLFKYLFNSLHFLKIFQSEEKSSKKGKKKHKDKSEDKKKEKKRDMRRDGKEE